VEIKLQRFVDVLGGDRVTESLHKRVHVYVFVVIYAKPCGPEDTVRLQFPLRPLCLPRERPGCAPGRVLAVWSREQQAVPSTQ
jgi:hypothetical protein